LKVQDAHEAIRPTHFSHTPEEIKDSLTPEQFALYKLVYNHTLASLMSPAQVKKTTYSFINNEYYFEMNENVVKFNGFLVLSPAYYLLRYKIRPHSLLEKKNLKSLTVTKVEVKEHLDKKPQRYNEGNLVQKLEKLGIGRPSTYNTFSKLLLHRGYVEHNNDKQKHFIPTDLGKAVHD